LAVEEELFDCWKEKLGSIAGIRIGVAWQGDARFLYDRLRSIPLVEFAPLAELSGVRLISLQKGPGTEQLRGAKDLFPIVDWSDELDEGSGAFMDTAALMKSVDLVVTSDSAVAHLAGALGVNVWVALSFAPEWRWQLQREDCPWYPTMRLFRQPQPGNWGSVFQGMAAKLRHVINARER